MPSKVPNKRKKKTTPAASSVRRKPISGAREAAIGRKGVFVGPATGSRSAVKKKKAISTKKRDTPRPADKTDKKRSTPRPADKTDKKKVVSKKKAVKKVVAKPASRKKVTPKPAPKKRETTNIREFNKKRRVAGSRTDKR